MKTFKFIIADGDIDLGALGLENRELSFEHSNHAKSFHRSRTGQAHVDREPPQDIQNGLLFSIVSKFCLKQ